MSTAALDLTQLEQAVWERSGKQEGAEVRFLCPAHDDHKPSARWSPKKESWFCDACKAGGGFKDLADRLEVDLGAGQPPRAKVTVGVSRPQVVDTYNYFDADGTLLFYIERREPGAKGKAKDFMQRRPSGDYGLGEDTRRVIYRFPQVREQVSKGGAVYVPEGEKDVHTLEALGKVATCNPGGAGNWRDEYSEALEGAHVTLIPDNDEQGRKHMREVALSLEGKVESLRVLLLPLLPPKGDVTDWLKTHSADDFTHAAEGAPVWLKKNPQESYQAYVVNTLGVNSSGKKTAEDAANGTADDEEPWWEIVPLSDPNPPAPPLPPELIPAALRAWLVDVAERLCVPVEIPAAAAIVAAGGTLGRGVGIYPQRYDDWLVYANFWGGTIAKPGMMKSPLIAEATKGARRLEAAAAEAFEEAAAAHDVKRERLELEIEACRKRMKDAIGKGIDTSALEADMVALKQEANAVPAAPRRLVVQDSTVEKLGELLQANPRGLLLLRDELAGWLRSLERLGREGDREFYLETWSGDGVYTFDRIKRGTVRIPHLCLSVFGGIQPGKLKRYIQDATTGGEGADGLLQRLQVVVWPESLGEWVNTDRTPDRAAWVRARKVFDALAEYDAAALGLETDEDGRAGLRFSAEAQEVFYEWRGELEQRVRGGELDSTPAFASHLSKYRSLMPGLALLFHLIGLADGAHDNTSVGREDARLAADWCDYLETHARRVYHGELERVALACHAIVEKIDAGEIKHEMKVRDIYRAEWEGLSDRATVLEVLGDLEESNHLRVVEAPTGGRPTAVIHLHPRLRQ